MPLVIVSGLPCSGKTACATRLADYLRTRIAQEGLSRMSVQCIDDIALHVARTAYATPVEEKKARGALMSAVERLLNRDTIVIADAMNYVKGFRYQLYCVARAVSTPHCVVYCGVPTDTARAWHTARVADDQYPETAFEELLLRYEEPDAMRRWDAPLFTVAPAVEDTIPFEDIWAALVLRKAPPPNLSTAVKKVAATNTLHELDRITQQIVSAVLQTQQEGVGTTAVRVEGTAAQDHYVQLLDRTLTMTELRRLRRQFININKAHTLPEARVAEAFVEYLNANLHP